MKKIVFLGICFLMHFYSFGQSELTLSNLDNLMQATYINPAKSPEYKLSIGLPVLSSNYFGATNTGFSFNDITQKNEGSNFAIKPWNDVLAKLKNQNFAYAGASVDLISVRFKVKHYTWSFNITEKVSTRISYPKDFATLIVKGNEPFIGGEVNLKNMGVDGTHERDFAVGIMKAFDRYMLGGRIKYIQGLSNVSFNPKNLSLATEANYYGLKATADATLNTSGIPKNNDDFSVQNYLTNTKNFGLGMDLGGSFKLTRKIIISASIINLGFINWSSNVTNYNIKGGSEFTGANLGKVLIDQIKTQEDNYDQEGNKILDSLKSSFQYSERSNSYSTFLIPQLYLSGKYFFTLKTQGIVTAYLEKYKTLRPAVTLGIQHQIGRIVNGILTYSIQYGKYNNFGLGLVIKPPVVPLQFYISGDNLINQYTIINNSAVAPLNSKAFNIRFGVNLVFGYINKQDKLNYSVVK